MAMLTLVTLATKAKVEVLTLSTLAMEAKVATKAKVVVLTSEPLEMEA